MDKVTTGEATEVTSHGAVLTGTVNVDIKDYNSVEFGMMVSDNLEDMNNHKGNMKWGKTLTGKDYTVTLYELTDNTKYYYCAFVFLNETQYVLGGIKNFTTKQGGGPTPNPTSDKVTTGETTEITAHSAVLAGKVNVDIKDYNSVAFGMMVSDNLEDVNNHKGDMKWGKTLIGKDYAIALDELEDYTKYYYCAFVFLNETQYEFGAIKDFTTLEVPVVKNERFSVSETKQVRFSRGNLQYTQSTQTWSFAEHQYDMLGESNMNWRTLADKIDLFGWSGNTATAQWGISTSSDDMDYSGSFADWGNNINDGDTLWRTLTRDEWDYLRNTRTNADNLVGIARINLNDGKYVDGLVLLPDDWIRPTGITFKSGFIEAFQDYAVHQKFALSEWQKMEATGAVFLPASGYRLSWGVQMVDGGYYWSATSPNCFIFFSSDAYIYHYNRSYGLSVRLVQDLD